jgi:hypothetical protein
MKRSYPIRGRGGWNAAPISVPRIFGLGNLFFSILSGTVLQGLFSSMILRRSKRTLVPTTKSEEETASSAASGFKITKKTV